MMPEIKIYGKKGCNLCEVAKKKISFFLEAEKLEKEVEFSFIDMDTVNGLTEGTLANVSDIPTTVINYKGEEVYRITKTIPNTQHIKEELDKYLAKKAE